MSGQKGSSPKVRDKTVLARPPPFF